MRAGWLCSCPRCKKLTVGANSAGSGVINVDGAPVKHRRTGRSIRSALPRPQVLHQTGSTGLTIRRMKIQVLSDLHLEQGGLVPEHHPDADVIVLATDLAPYTEGLVGRFASCAEPSPCRRGHLMSSSFAASSLASERLPRASESWSLPSRSSGGSSTSCR